MATFRVASTDLALRAAVEVIKAGIRNVAMAMPSKKIPPTLIGYVRNGVGYVNAGGPGGWAAPNAYMFETPGSEHPTFAHKGTPRYRDPKMWFVQPYRPFMEEGAELSAQRAADRFEEVWVSQYLKGTGWK